MTETNQRRPNVWPQSPMEQHVSTEKKTGTYTFFFQLVFFREFLFFGSMSSNLSVTLRKDAPSDTDHVEPLSGQKYWKLRKLGGGDPKKQNVSKHVLFFGLEPQFCGPNFRNLWYSPANNLSLDLSMLHETFLKIWAKSEKKIFWSMAKKWNVFLEHVLFFPDPQKNFFLRSRSNFQESFV